MNKSDNDKKNNYKGKLSESGIIHMVEPRTIYDSDNADVEQQMQVVVVFDYTSFKPDYDINDEWWYYDEASKTIHVMMEDAAKVRFWNLMKKIEEGQNLTQQEAMELNKYENLRVTLPRKAFDRFIYRYYHTYRYDADVTPMVGEDKVIYGEPKKEYRTKSKSEDSIDNLPSHLALITNAQYRESLSLKEQRKGSYLVPSVLSAEDMVYDGTTLFIKGYPASEAILREVNKDKNVPIEKIDLPLLRMFYSIILSDFMHNAQKFGVVNETVTVYVPDLAELLGKGRNISKKDVETIIKKASSFQTICGVLKDPRRPNGIGTVLPLLLWSGYYEETNTIRFQSPYMTELIMRIYDVSIRKDKLGIPKLKRDGTPLLEASYSYLVKSSIVKERNKRAAEIVMVVVATIEQAGTREPHLKARTIMDRVPQLQEAYDQASPGNRNRVLARAFKKAWELLETQTLLKEKYPTIVLPDPKNTKNIPTSTTLDMVFTFPHR